MNKNEKLKIDIEFLLNNILAEKDLKINLKSIIFDFMYKNNFEIKNQSKIQDEIVLQRCREFEKKEG